MLETKETFDRMERLDNLLRTEFRYPVEIVGHEYGNCDECRFPLSAQKNSNGKILAYCPECANNYRLG